MWRAILVEDEECAGAELARLFPWHYFQFELIDEAENMQEVKALIATTQPDLAIIDIRVPETEGLYYHFNSLFGSGRDFLFDVEVKKLALGNLLQLN